MPAHPDVPQSWCHAGALRPQPSKRRKVISLFSGCGGMDLGFLGGFSFGGAHYERLPFDIVWANEIDDLACDTYAANIGEEHLQHGDIADVIHTLPAEADVVIGGFPCQDVSINGRRSLAEGERTILYRRMIEVIVRCKPAVFVAENVKGLLMTRGRRFFERMLADFALPGYTVGHKLYLASEHGVPQRRESGCSSLASRMGQLSIIQKPWTPECPRRRRWKIWRAPTRTRRRITSGAGRNAAQNRAADD